MSGPAQKKAGCSRIFLTGFMAAGKTTVGDRLADRLGWRFIDLDHAVESHTGCTITQIFGAGEEVFRARERSVLELVSKKTRLVIALGGGALIWKDTLEYVREKGELVYLSVDIDTLRRRLEADETERPLLSGRRGTALSSHIESLFEKRCSFYESADITVVCSDDRSTGSIVEEIIHAIR